MFVESIPSWIASRIPRVHERPKRRSRKQRRRLCIEFLEDRSLFSVSPLIYLPTPQSVNAGSALTFAGWQGNQVWISDSSGIDTDTAQVSLSVAHGSLALSTASGLALFGDNTNQLLRFSGTISAIDLALNNLIYSPDYSYLGADNLQISVTELDAEGLSATSSLGINVTAPATGSTATLFNGGGAPAIPDTGAGPSVELGTRFTSDVNGSISGLRFYKAPGDTGPHTVSLWSSTGVLLARATSTSETASGWQQVNFGSPVAISAGATYVASYHSTSGRFAMTVGGFASPLASGVLRVPTSGGVFAYGSGGFPTQSYASSNYWLDVVLNTTPPAVTSFGVANGATNVLTGAALSVTFNQVLDASTVNASTVRLMNGSTVVAASVSYDAATRTATLTPTGPLANSQSYTIAVVGGASGVKDLAGNAVAQATTSSFTTAAPSSTFSLWNGGGTPTILDTGAGLSVELGTRFTSDVNGSISGLRFYKSPGDTGPHTVSLWSSSGALLARATSTSETASGWQQVNFSTPVATSAGATYVASYHSTSGRFAMTVGGFSSPLTSGVLRVPTSGGVFSYGGIGFPTQSYASSNYWLDVVLNSTPPAVSSFSVASGATNVLTGTALSVSFNQVLDAATVNASTVRIMNGSTVVAASVSYNAATRTATLTPTGPLANSQTYTIAVVGGASGVKDLVGNAIAQTTTSSFTTAAPSSTFSLWNGGGTPTILDTGVGPTVELGTRFTSDVNGSIGGLRFYKAPGDAGPHTVSLWSSSGVLLARAVSTSETASGWQQVNFSAPVAIAAGATYVASYRSTTGRFAMSVSGFATPLTSGVLHVPTSGGVYAYGTGNFPTQSYSASNYWVDVVLDSTPPTVTSFSVANGATNVLTGTALTVSFNQVLDAATVNTNTVRLMNGSTVVAASVSYNPATRTATITPSTALFNLQTYSLVVVGGANGVKDVAGNGLAQTMSSAFTTSAPTVAVSLWNNAGVPSILDTGAGPAVELGTRFTSDANGTISGLRFYKSPGDTGPHTVSLWSSTGVLLARAVSTSETASGWQQVNFSAPVTISAGATYVASYHSTSGHFAMTVGGFANPVASGALRVAAGGGVFSYGGVGFPTQSYASSNYWVDVVLNTPATTNVQALTLNAVPPLGWEVYDAQVSNTVQSAAGAVSYTVNLQSGQLLALAARADAVALGVSLIDPNGNQVASNSAAAGGTIVLNPYRVTTTGTWTITLTMPVGGSGSYWLQMAKNAGIEGAATTPGTRQSLNSSYLDITDSLGRYAWLGQISGIAGSNVDSFNIDLSSKVGQQIDVFVASRGADLSGQTLELVAPNGTTILAIGSVWSVDGVSGATGLRIAGYTVTSAGVYTVRITSSVSSSYALIVNDSIDLGVPSASDVLTYLVANNLTTQTSVADLLNSLSFDRVFQSMTSDEVLSALLRVGAINGYNNLATLKAALPGRGVNLANLRADGVLSALSTATYGNLLTSVTGPPGAIQAKNMLQASFAADRLAFVGVFATPELVQLFDDSITTSAGGASDRFMAYMSQGSTVGMPNLVKQYQLWVHDGVRVNNPTPQDTYAATSQMATGTRVIHLADFAQVAGYGLGTYPTIGYLDLVDGYGNPAQYYTIWMDQWAVAIQNKITSFFTQYKALGGQLDMLVMDIESVGMDYFRMGTVDHRVNPNSNPSGTVFQAIMADPRWPAVKDQLLKAGLTEAALNSMATWVQGGTEAAIWNAVMQERVANYLNQAIYQPIKQLYPTAVVSNYGNYLHTPTIASGSLAALTQSPYTIGTVVGNTQAVDLYGYSQGIYTGGDDTIRFRAGVAKFTFTQNTDGSGNPLASGIVRADFGFAMTGVKAGDRVMISNAGNQPIDSRYNGTFTVLSVSDDFKSITYALQLSGPSNPPANYTYTGTQLNPVIADFWTSYRALVADVKLLRTQVATSDVPFTPWVTSPNWLMQDQGLNHTYYPELLLHAGLSGAQDFLWWKSSTTADSAGAQLVSKLLSELDSLVGYADRQTLSRTDVGFTDGYILTGMEAAGKRVYRLTPDPTQAVNVIGSSGTVQIQVGGQTLTFANASIYTPANPASSLGYWIVQTQGSTQLVGSVNQVLSQLSALI